MRPSVYELVRFRAKPYRLICPCCCASLRPRFRAIAVARSDVRERVKRHAHPSTVHSDVFNISMLYMAGSGAPDATGTFHSENEGPDDGVNPCFLT